MLDKLEKMWFDPAVIPFDTPLCEDGIQHDILDDRFMVPQATVDLDGMWELTNAEDADWENAIAAKVPGTIVSAFMAAGKLEDIRKEKNVDIARDLCFRSWKLRRTFKTERKLFKSMLSFEGVANECSVWLDGQLLGKHAGAFGGPDFVLNNLEAGEHWIEVLVNAIPNTLYQPENGGDDFRCHEPRVRNEFYTMVTPLMNYGHHYVNLPTHGIWRSVRLKETTPCYMDVLVGTKNRSNALNGIVDMYITVKGKICGEICSFNGEIVPVNFDGKSTHFETMVSRKKETESFHLQISIPEAQLWWPHDFGKPNLYHLRLRLDDNTGVQAYYETDFGIRSIEMEETRSRYCKSNWYYAWRFVVNGIPIPIHGENWGMIDATAQAGEKEYRRLLELAQQEHCNMLRVWGNGVIEIERFYELCDQMGIMVFQEWPLSSITHNKRKLQLMHDTVERNMIHLRNHSCIVLWCGGNELDYDATSPLHNGIRMLGRMAYELDGTRPFHISEEWGGSFHEYPVFWGGKDLEGQLATHTIFLGEFGLAAMPCYESVLQYLPDAERDKWPSEKGSVLRYHTPMFDNSDDLQRIMNYASEMMPLDSLEHFCLGSQLGQVVGVRHNIEFQRCGWPEDTTGSIHYKLNEMYPAVSWGAIDHYGVPRMVHYFIENACRPQYACLVVEAFNLKGKDIAFPVHLLDDNFQMKNKPWRVTVTAYDYLLRIIKRQTYTGQGSIMQNERIGMFELDKSQTESTPLLIHVELENNGKQSSTFYWFNFKEHPGCLMKLPRTELDAIWGENSVVIHNRGDVPAVGVHFDGWHALKNGMVEDNFFWLNPGETRTLAFQIPEHDNLRIACWNGEIDKQSN